MEFSKLNPFIRTAGIYEVINRTEDCIAYDARVIYMISGDVAVSIDGEKKFHIGPGNLLYIPSGIKYKLKGQYLRAAIITFDLTDAYSNQAEKLLPEVPDVFDRSRIHDCSLTPFDRFIMSEDMESERDKFISMTSIATSAEGAWRSYISAELKLILLKLAESVSETALPVRMIEALDNYIRENCSEEISNTEIGAIFGYHPFYVSRVLKEKKGITLRQYIIGYRLKAAKRSLELTKKSIADIAEETGFTDASYFTKTFRQAFGMTPKEWRNKFKEEFI